jgi:hypothetical protein
MENGMGDITSLREYIDWLNQVIPWLEGHAVENDLDAVSYLEAWDDAFAWATHLLSSPDHPLSPADVELLEPKPKGFIGEPGWLVVHRLKRLRDRLTGNPPAPPVPDGPYAEGVFGHGGTAHRVSLKRWLLLKVLWGKESVSTEDACAAVWPGEDVPDNRLKNLAYETGEALLKLKLPYEITRPMTGHLGLCRFPDKS